MFPPMTPQGERKRYESELEILEREAMWHAYYGENRVGLFQRVANFVARLSRQPQQQTAQADPCYSTATQESPATSGC